MYSSFLGIEIGKRGLFAHQRAQNTVSHNSNNVNTPGFSRQRAVLESSYGRYGMGAQWQIGTGVKVSDVDRIRDDFSDMQFRNENSALGKWHIQRDVLKQVEAVFNEPGDIGISGVFNEFWKSLETLSKDAGSAEARETVKESAVTFTNTINHAIQQLTDIENDINFRIGTKVDEVNSIAKQITQLNAEIQQLEITGVTAPDLRDKRDLLLDELSTYINFTSYEDENGVFTVNVGGTVLVKGNDSYEMAFNQDAEPPKVVWTDYGNAEVNLSRGEIKGLMELRGKVIDYRGDLALFAVTFAMEFNEVHKQGYDLNGDKGGEFFTIQKEIQDYYDIINNPTADDDAKKAAEEAAKKAVKESIRIIEVNSEIIADPSKIAAAESPNGIPGDNRNALELSKVRNNPLEFKWGWESGSAKKTAATDDFYGALVAKIGVDSREAIRMTESQYTMVSQIDERRKSISGVSLDEEMTKMILNQHAYTASARLITSIDEMIDTVVNRLGIVGR